MPFPRIVISTEPGERGSSRRRRRRLSLPPAPASHWPGAWDRRWGVRSVGNLSAGAPPAGWPSAPSDHSHLGGPVVRVPPRPELAIWPVFAIGEPSEDPALTPLVRVQALRRGRLSPKGAQSYGHFPLEPPRDSIDFFPPRF